MVQCVSLWLSKLLKFDLTPTTTLTYELICQNRAITAGERHEKSWPEMVETMLLSCYTVSTIQSGATPLSLWLIVDHAPCLCGVRISNLIEDGLCLIHGAWWNQWGSLVVGPGDHWRCLKIRWRPWLIGRDIDMMDQHVGCQKEKDGAVLAAGPLQCSHISLPHIPTSVLFSRKITAQAFFRDMSQSSSEIQQ